MIDGLPCYRRSLGLRACRWPTGILVIEAGSCGEVSRVQGRPRSLDAEPMPLILVERWRPVPSLVFVIGRDLDGRKKIRGTSGRLGPLLSRAGLLLKE